MNSGRMYKLLAIGFISSLVSIAITTNNQVYALETATITLPNEKKIKIITPFESGHMFDLGLSTVEGEKSLTDNKEDFSSEAYYGGVEKAINDYLFENKNIFEIDEEGLVFNNLLPVIEEGEDFGDGDHFQSYTLGYIRGVLHGMNTILEEAAEVSWMSDLGISSRNNNDGFGQSGGFGGQVPGGQGGGDNNGDGDSIEPTSPEQPSSSGPMCGSGPCIIS